MSFPVFTMQGKSFLNERHCNAEYMCYIAHAFGKVLSRYKIKGNNPLLQKMIPQLCCHIDRMGDISKKAEIPRRFALSE
jgi:hypothetical protein